MRPGRLQLIDLLRGVAILAMIAYHLIWDLNYYGFVSVGIGVDATWFTFQRSIVTAFLLLVGAGLWLAHGRGIDWRRFWRREALLVLAALGVSAVTWFQFGSYFAYFGILHAIALSSLLLLPLLRAPVWLSLVVAALVLLLPAIFATDLFNVRWLAWIGFFTAVPETADLVPLFPWFGVVVLGATGMRLAAAAPALAWRSEHPAARTLAWLGRWSLVIYLIHQPLLFGIVTPLAHWRDSRSEQRIAAFTEQCNTACLANEDAAYCTAYCGCALDITVRQSLWDARPEDLTGMTRLCREMAR